MTAQPTREQSPPTNGEPAERAARRQPLWPILIAREAHARVDGHVGMTLTIWLGSNLGLGLSLLFFTNYIWPLWRRSWMTIWPTGLPESVLALPLIALLFGALFNKLWHGRVWAGLILGVYLVLHANLYVPPLNVTQTSPSADPPVTAMQLDEQTSAPQLAAQTPPTTLQMRRIGPVVRAHPEIIVMGLTTALVPVVALWGFGILSLSFLWPSLMAGVKMFNTTVQARDDQRYFNEQRELKTQVRQRQLAHNRAMAQHQFVAWSDEEQHAQLENGMARQHQLLELRKYQQALGLSQNTAAPAEPVSAGDDTLLANLVGGSQQTGSV